MEFWELVIIVILNILSFTIGARIGQKIVKGQEVKVIPSPIQVINELKEEKNQAKEQERNKVIAENIDNYDGTSIGQKDVPK